MRAKTSAKTRAIRSAIRMALDYSLMRNRQYGRRDFLFAMTGMAAALATEAGRAASPTFMYIGSYTSQARGHGEGISIYRRGGESDRWKLIQVVDDLPDPSFLITDRPGR